ncbi:hypothetical protein HJFPF1_04999 [Paramyrothecium foliicola]|nr:hypothetical protein HJFPF1_04999 [Paramyrothecium foliicola]
MADLSFLMYECHVFLCDQTWATDDDRQRHEIEDHYYCLQCDVFFESRNSIKAHLNSELHRGLTLQCPLCQNHFCTASAVTQHLESGNCSSPEGKKLDRIGLYELVRSRDSRGVITKNLLDWHERVEFQATDKSWNGFAFECYLCRRRFGHLSRLNCHLGSQAHRQALYHCPHSTCRMEFKSLGGLLMHLESETCGYTRFENVQTALESFTGLTNRITL